eukprot:3665632-Prymnesium_polylepis.1
MSTLTDLTADLTDLVSEKNCGPILIRLNWHDAVRSLAPITHTRTRPPPTSRLALPATANNRGDER